MNNQNHIRIVCSFSDKPNIIYIQKYQSLFSEQNVSFTFTRTKLHHPFLFEHGSISWPVDNLMNELLEERPNDS